METNSPAGESTPELPLENSAPAPAGEPPAGEMPGTDGPPEQAQSGSAADRPPDDLTLLAEASQRARLPPADEERMGALLKEALLGGRSGVARAIEVLPHVPWIVGVRAVETVWPELTAGFRTQLLSGLAKEETDAARRIRLSLARALFKLDPPVALKIATAVAREFRDAETGGLSPRQAQIFANVFIGRGKPWLAQLPLAELKPADLDALVHCAVLSVFLLPHPPVTQLGIIKWAQEQGRLGKLEPAALEALTKGLARWSGKWQGALRKEVAELPEEIAAILKPAAEPPAVAEGGPEVFEEPRDAAEDADADHEEDEDEEEAETSGAPRERPVYEPRPQKAGAEAPRERPVYTPRNAGANVPRNFNLPEALRSIEAYANGLRAELAAAQTRSRKEERFRPEKSGPIIAGEPSAEELARLNLQLEARNAELQERITELTQHSEDLAVSTGAMAGQEVSHPDAQLRTLLALKLQEDFADFLALEKAANDLVVRVHYPGLLRHVFEVLQQLDVPLKAEESSEK